MIDANAYIGEWPFRRLNHAAPDALLRKMDALGIEKAVGLAAGERLLQRRDGGQSRVAWHRAAAS